MADINGDKKKFWFTLDNAAKIFPGQNSNTWSNSFRVCFELKEKVEPDILKQALSDIMPRFPCYNVRIRRGFFWYYLEENKNIPESARRDLIISLITLKYTQSNSVCYASGGQTIGVGAGQQSRIHCTRLAGNKADNLWLRHNEKVLNLPFIDGLRKCEADNAIDLYISDEYEDLLKDGVWQRYFTTCPEPFTAQEKKAWHEKMTNVALGSDAFFPFEDNIERAARSGVKYIAQPGGSVRDGAVIECCDGFGMAMAMTGIRLFHH